MTVGGVEFASQDFGPARIDETDLALLAETTGLSREACLARLGGYQLAEFSEAWKSAETRTAAEIAAFYAGTDLYLWELFAWNTSASYAPYLARLARLAARFPVTTHPRVLDFGSGIGTSALTLARLGYQVTVADIPGTTFDFARARLARHGFPAAAIELAGGSSSAGSGPTLPRGAFDLIVCFDVLEHVPDPARAAQALARALRTGGGAAIVAAFDTQGEDWPHHLPGGYALFGGHRWERYLDRLGLGTLGGQLYRKPGPAGRLAHRARYELWRSTGLHVTRLPR